MPRQCTICNHENRESVELSLVRGEPIRDIAGRHSLSRAAIQRYKEGHLPTTLVKSEKAGELAHADNLLDELLYVPFTTVKTPESTKA